MDDLPIRLEQFRNAFRPAGGTHGQQIGEESYALRCNGRALSVLAEAADEIARLRSELAAVREMYTEQGLTIKAQQDELAACREDAERYRWLREHWDDVNHPVDFIICNSFVTTLDADVDAARKGEVET